MLSLHLFPQKSFAPFANYFFKFAVWAPLVSRLDGASYGSSGLRNIGTGSGAKAPSLVTVGVSGIPTTNQLHPMKESRI